MFIKASNPSLLDNVRTYLSAKTSAGDTSTSVVNSTGLAQNDYVVFGELGEDRSEIRKISTLTGSVTVAVDTTLFDHPVDTPITFIKYNKVRIYRSTNAGVSYSLLTTVDIQPDRLITTYDDTAAQSTYYYKVAYFNSTSSQESGLSAALIATGYTSYSLKALQDRVISLFPDPTEDFLDRNEITDWLNDYYMRMATACIDIDQGYFQKDNTASPGTLTNGTDSYSLPEDFFSMKRLEVSYDGTNYYRVYPSQVTYGYPSQTFDQTRPLYDFIQNNFRLRPTPATASGTYKIWYNYLPTELSAATDSIDIFLRPFKNGFVYYALSQAKRKHGGADSVNEAIALEKYADKVLESLATRLSRRQKDVGTFVELTDTNFLDTYGEPGGSGSW